MKYWKRFLHWIRPLRPERVQLDLQTDIQQDLRDLAEQMRRRPEAIADELILYALQQYQNAQENLVAWEALTRREKQIAARICAGYTNQEIAYHLYISPETVKSHLRRILQKFKVKNRQELQAALREWDLDPWL